MKEYIWVGVFTQFFVTLIAFWLVRRLSVTTSEYYAGAFGCTLSMTFYFWLKLTGVERLSHQPRKPTETD